MSSITTSVLAAAEVPAAGGAPIGQLIIGTVFAGTMTIGVLLIGWLHRTERTTLLTTIGNRVGKLEGLPGWAAVPAAIGWGSLALAFLGVYWDISLHIDNGRDEGPLANAAHYPILFGLQGLFLAGVLAMVMPKKNSYVGPSAVRVAKGWRVPIASVTLMACAVLGYLGFPLDDVWHRMFGQDVTLWGPTHLMMISGAVLSIIALVMLDAEGERAYGPPKGFMQKVRRRSFRVMAPTAMMIAISLFLAEWDWGVQQYLMIWQPLILAAGGGLALVFARRWGGPGFAILAALAYMAARFGMNLVVGVGFGQSMPTLPLWIVEALVVEAVFASAWMRSRTVAPLVASGVGIGTVGFAFQYLWSQFFMPTPWNEALLFPGVPMAIAAGIGGATLGYLFAMAVRGELALVTQRRILGPAAGITLLALAGIAGNQDYSSGSVITTTISDARVVKAPTGDGPLDSAVREATLTVRFQNPQDADGNNYVTAIAWQGGGMVSDAMDEIAPGVFRSTEPIPIGGAWKTLVRTQDGRRLLAAPVFLPADPGIPVAGHVNPGTETMRMQTELMYLQRERKPDVPAYLWMPALIAVLGTMGLFSIGLAFAAGRVGTRTRREFAEDAVPETADAAAARAAAGKGPTPSARPAYHRHSDR